MLLGTLKVVAWGVVMGAFGHLMGTLGRMAMTGAF
jgi:hypothetical protein